MGCRDTYTHEKCRAYKRKVYVDVSVWFDKSTGNWVVGSGEMARFLVKIDARVGNYFASDVSGVSGAGFTVTHLMPNSRGIAMGLGIAGNEDWFVATIEGEIDAGDVWRMFEGMFERKTRLFTAQNSTQPQRQF
jgi:hypothetical protein